MILRNPTDSEVSMAYLGVSYSIPAMGESENLVEEVATHWKKNIHQFLEEVAVSGSSVEPEVKVEEAVDEAPAPVMEPKVKTASKKVK